MTHGDARPHGSPASTREGAAGDDPGVSALLVAWTQGDGEAGGRLMTVLYDELRRMAAAYLRGERRARPSLGQAEPVPTVGPGADSETTTGQPTNL